MDKLIKGTPDDILTHVNDILNIDLKMQLNFNKMRTLSAYSLIPPLLVLYRYAEAVNKTIEIRDMMASGHKSHLMGSELDFHFPGKRTNCVSHIRIAGDLLTLKDKLMPSLDSFRVGAYFEHFDKANLTTFEAFEKKYKRKKAAASMHLGTRFKWYIAEKYDSKKLSGLRFGIWGRGGRTYGKQRKIEKVIKSWKKGHLTEAQISAVATQLNSDKIRLELHALTEKSYYQQVANTVTSLYRDFRKGFQ